MSRSKTFVAPLASLALLILAPSITFAQDDPQDVVFGDHDEVVDTSGPMLLPLPAIVQEADSGWRFGAGEMHQNFTEFQQGNPSFTAKTSPFTTNVGYERQSDHLDWRVEARYAFGTDDSVSGTPGVSTCGAGLCVSTANDDATNQFLNVNSSMGYGFVLWDQLVAVPELFLGWHNWNYAPNSEHFHDYRAGTGLKLRYAIDAIVLGVEGRYGQTFDARMNAAGAQAPFKLGSDRVASFDGTAVWVINPQLKIYAEYAYERFGYGQSKPVPDDNAAAGLGTEPASRTRQNRVEFGIRVD